MSDPFIANHARAVTPSDAASISAKSLFVGGAGDLAVIPAATNSVSVTLENVPAGSFIPLAVSKVLATGTTASAIVALS